MAESLPRNWTTNVPRADRPDLRLPGESKDYRGARNELLDAEIALRREIERVAVLRRALPPSDKVVDD